MRTFIQSGNVIFTASAGVSKGLAGVIAAKIAGRFGYKAPVILRTVQQFRDLVSNSPFPAGRPTPAHIAALDPNRSSPDVFVVRGEDIYPHLPTGIADIKLTNAWFDSKLGTVSTGRNWRTVTKLLALMED